MLNKTSLDEVCAGLCYAMGIEPPKEANAPSEEFCKFIAEAFGGEKVDRIFMYNPDAVAQWIYEKYPHLFTQVENITDFKLPICSVMPSVTPVCFGTMYTGAQPAVHGIQSYVKPVITIDTIFDALIRAGKKPVILADSNSSLAKIYLEREMDYFIYDTGEEINAKAMELIMEDKYDFIVVYNANYDTIMHKRGPESIEALGELKMDIHIYGVFNELIKSHWKNHNILSGFAMDHGCHEIDGGCGSHGLDMEEDLNIVHMYTAHKAL